VSFASVQPDAVLKLVPLEDSTAIRLGNNRIDTFTRHTEVRQLQAYGTNDNRQLDNTPTVTTSTIPTTRQPDISTTRHFYDSTNRQTRRTTMAPDANARQIVTATVQALPTWLTYSPIVGPSGTSWTILRLPLTYYGPSVCISCYPNRDTF
jgi:hypothetical protein